jgi:hypothetical protein
VQAGSHGKQVRNSLFWNTGPLRIRFDILESGFDVTFGIEGFVYEHF